VWHTLTRPETVHQFNRWSSCQESLLWFCLYSIAQCTVHRTPL